MKSKKKDVDIICSDCYTDDINELTYDERVELERKSKVFEASFDMFETLWDVLPCANETYVYLNSEHYESMIFCCKEMINSYKKLENLSSRQKWEFDTYVQCLKYLQELNIDWDKEVLLYEYDC